MGGLSGFSPPNGIQNSPRLKGLEYDMGSERDCPRPLLSICLYSWAGCTAGLWLPDRSDASAELHS